MEQDLPAHIQAQLDEAEAIEAAIAAEQAALANPQDTGNLEVVTQPEPVVEPEVKPEPQVQLPDPEEETWKSRFNALQGKFNAEVPRLHQQLKESNHALADLRAEVDRLKQAPAKPEVVNTVTSEDEETFGSDLIAVMKKVAKQEASEAAKQLEPKVASVSQKVDAVLKDQAETAGDRFMAAIARDVPDWETINADQKWLDWLGEYSPELGGPRQYALDVAQERFDHVRVVALFKAYKEKFPNSPAATTAPTSKAQQELQSQVAPAKTAAPATQPNTDRIWTGAEYERAYDVRLGHTMTAKEVEGLQAEAERAYNEGRVRW